MGFRILAGDGIGDSGTRAVLYCSTTMTALPYIFDSREDAEAFIEEYGDVRRLDLDERVRCFEEWRDRADRAELIKQWRIRLEGHNREVVQDLIHGRGVP